MATATRFVTGIVLALLAALAAAADPAPACACAEPGSCTRINGINVAFAHRAVVRQRMRAIGAIAVKEDNAFSYDDYRAPEGPWFRVSAQYHDNRLWNMRYVYADPAYVRTEIDEIRERFGEPEAKTGDFEDGVASRWTWKLSDSVQLIVSREAGENYAIVEWRVPEIQARWDAWIAGTGSEYGPAPPQPKFFDIPAPDHVALSPRYATLRVESESPVFLGERSWTVAACGEGLWFEHLANVGEPPRIVHYVVPRPDGASDVVVGVRDGRDDLVFRFDAVAPGRATRSAPVLDCSLPDARLTWTPAKGPGCLEILQTNVATRTVLERVIAASGIEVEGAELAGDSRISINMDIPAADLLQLLADESGLELVRVDDTHYRFSKPD